MTLGTGTLSIKDQAGSAATSQTFAGVTLGPGGATISVAANGSTYASSTLALGAITVGAGGSVNFMLPSVGTITTSTPNAGGMLGIWATVNKTDWAVNSAGSGVGAIAALATYQNDDFSSSANNVSITKNDAPSSAFTINTLRFNASGTSPGGFTLTLPDAGGAISNINNNGILVTPTVGAYGARSPELRKAPITSRAPAAP